MAGWDSRQHPAILITQVASIPNYRAMAARTLALTTLAHLEISAAKSGVPK